ncbi:hypothetical protein FACS1894191_5140 [Clostridia bacterium]|nr:hypothetical protein FACS1894191_5140 [Clostridia bacterium]
MKKDKHFGIIVDPELHFKLHYVAKNTGKVKAAGAITEIYMIFLSGCMFRSSLVQGKTAVLNIL